MKKDTTPGIESLAGQSWEKFARQTKTTATVAAVTPKGYYLDLGHRRIGILPTASPYMTIYVGGTIDLKPADVVAVEVFGYAEENNETGILDIYDTKIQDGKCYMERLNDNTGKILDERIKFLISDYSELTKEYISDSRYEKYEKIYFCKIIHSALKARLIRRKTGLPQYKFASKYGIPKRSYQNWENGTTECPDYVMKLLEGAVNYDILKSQIDEIIKGKGDDSMDNTLLGIFERTINNCKFYEKEGKTNSLLNEIGVLRGIMYCMELCGQEYRNEDTIHFIEIQQKLKEKD